MGRFPEANKRFGQHFLHAPKIIDAITTDLPPGCDGIIEVGPGPAVLTPKLKAQGLPLTVLEMDTRFQPLLAELLGSENVIMGDALEVDLTTLLRERRQTRTWLVSNLPYNVSVPLTLAFMRTPAITRMTLMYQKEVAEKFHPRPGKNTMSSLNALAEIFFDVRRVCDAPPGAFSPPPKVHSQVLSFTRKAEPLVPIAEWDLLENFLRAVFANRRKQLQGQLKERWGQAFTVDAFRGAQVPETIRAEALDLPTLLRLWQLDQRQRMV